MRQMDTEGFTQLAENPDAGDETLRVVFCKHPLLNEAKSTEAGRPIYDSVDFIRIAVPGDKDNIIFQPVDETHVRRFGARYRRWKESGESESASGTPLAAWPAIERSQVEELAYFNCRTVEQLADMPDAVAQKFAGIQALKRRAKDYLEAAKGSAHVAQMRAELEKRDQELAALKAQFAEFAAAQKQSPKAKT